MCRAMELPRRCSTRECLQSRVDYVRKTLPKNEKKINPKPVNSVSVLEYSNSREGIAPDPNQVELKINAKAPTNNKQLESFIGPANFYARIIPDFATIMLLV